MSVIYIALPIAILLGGAAMVACVLCIRSGQYDDMETPSVRILIEDRKQKDSQPSQSPDCESET
tara:strand:- start:32990 stop:33181 length:192 start_codon:yes stop_codon:yes gene_type:complete